MTKIHHTAVIDEAADLAPDVEVGPFAIIERDVVIGPGSRIAAHAVVKRFTQMGARNVVAEHAVIGGDPQHLAFEDPEMPNGVHIGDDNTFREHVTVGRAWERDNHTRIGDRNFFMVNAHVAHDCVVGDETIFANNATLAGHIEVGDKAFISGNVAIHQFCRVGRHAFISGLARVSLDCLPFITVSGNPARSAGLNSVGLRRSGFSAEDISCLKKAYRLLVRSGMHLTDAIPAIREMQSPLADELAGFAESSPRGFTR